MILVVTNLTKVFSENEDRISGIRNVSFSLSEGECIGISGPSGSGKSTLLSILCGKQSCDSGEILFCNEPLKNYDRKTKSKILQIVCQDSNTALNRLRRVDSILFDVMLTLNYKKSFFYSKLYSLLEDFNLPTNVMRRYVSSLSGGERQRIAIIRSLMFYPMVVILDESFSSLDSKTKQYVIEIFKRYKTQGLSIIFVSHDVKDLQVLADKVIFLKNGGITSITEVNPNTNMLYVFKKVFGTEFYTCMQEIYSVDNSATKMSSLIGE